LQKEKLFSLTGIYKIFEEINVAKVTFNFRKSSLRILILKIISASKEHNGRSKTLWFIFVNHLEEKK
jgi:hypothetical protein